MSERNFVTLRKIEHIEPIEGAERVELAFVDGWRCVIPKNQYAIGEEILFIEADAALKNVNDERVDFLKKTSYKCWKKDNVVLAECLRIKTIKLAGQFSQGVVFKLSVFMDEINKAANNTTSLDEALNIVHYDELSDEMRAIINPENAMKARGTFPSFVPKTDEERLQNLTNYFEKYKEKEFEVSIKYDGSSMSVGYSIAHYPSNPFFVCSRNQLLDTDAENNFCRVAKSKDLESILIDYSYDTGMELCLQGELVGPGINGNRDGYKEFDFFIFRIWNITEQNWMSSEERLEFCRKYSLPHVKVLNTACKAFVEYPTMEDFVKATYITSDNGHQIEGLVFKSTDGEVSFKVINPNYLLKNQDK